MRKFRVVDSSELWNCKMFGDDKRHGKLFVNESGRIFCFADGDPDVIIELFPEKGGWRNEENVFRWYDKETGKRKKVYVKSLISDYFCTKN